MKKQILIRLLSLEMFTRKSVTLSMRIQLLAVYFKQWKSANNSR